MAFYNPLNPQQPSTPPPANPYGPPAPGLFGQSTQAWRKAPDRAYGYSPFGGIPNAHGTKATDPNAPTPQSTINKAMSTVSSARQGAQQQGQPYGSESGPGILESWFNQRVNGTDPAYEYAMNRGGDAIDARMAAGGSFNSGARGQQLSDFAANMAAQRLGQLDTLAGGASGEHMGRLGMMFGQGLGLANGQAGAGTAYDTAAAGNMAASAAAQQQMNLAKAGVDSKANQGLLNNAFNAYSIFKMGQGGGGNGGYTSVDGGAGNPYPQY